MKSEGIYRGFSYDGREYIVYYNVTSRPHIVVVNFPDADRPVRVECNFQNSSENSSGSFMTHGRFEVPSEVHFSWEANGWEFYTSNEHMILIETETNHAVFLEPVNGFKWIKDNYVDLPDDVYDLRAIIKFDDKIVIRLKLRYHKNKESYYLTSEKFVFWNNDGSFEYPTNERFTQCVEDCGSYRAVLNLNNEIFELSVPGYMKKDSEGKLVQPMLNGKEGREIHSNENEWNEIEYKFIEASGLKIHRIDEMIDLEYDEEKEVDNE